MPCVTYPAGEHGPLVTLVVAVSGPRQIALRRAGRPVPPPQSAQGLIDTGASCSCLDRSFIEALGLEPTGSVLIHTPSTGTQPVWAQQFDVEFSFSFDDHSPPIRVTLPVLECDFAGHPLQALLGRDLLERAILVYNGPLAQFSLCL